MPVSPNDIGNFAKELFELYDGEPNEVRLEVAIRSAVSRLFYSVFLEVRAQLGITGTSGIHGRVQGALRRRQGGKTLVDLYKDLRELRESADYALSDSGWHQKYRKAERLHDRILARL